MSRRDIAELQWREYIETLLGHMKVCGYDSGLADRIERNIAEFEESDPDVRIEVREVLPPEIREVLMPPAIDRVVASIAAELDETEEPEQDLATFTEDDRGASMAWIDWGVGGSFAVFRQWWKVADVRTLAAWRASQEPDADAEPETRPTPISGMTFGAAIVKMLQEAAGLPVTAEIMAARATEMVGRQANLGSMDSLALQMSYKNPQIKRVGPRTWAWREAA